MLGPKTESDLKPKIKVKDKKTTISTDVKGTSFFKFSNAFKNNTSRHENFTKDMSIWV